MLQLEDKLKSDYVTDKSKKKKYLDKHKSWLEEEIKISFPSVGDWKALFCARPVTQILTKSNGRRKTTCFKGKVK